MTTTTRVTFTLPSDLTDDIKLCASVLGVSRSALVAESLSALHDLARILRDSGATDSLDSDGVMRARGRSIELLQARIAEAHHLLSEDGSPAGEDR
jgi:hypothetical protein